MKKIRIKLDSINKVKGFVNIANRCEGKVELLLGNYRANGKSVMDICTLDLKNNLILDIKSEDLAVVIHELEPYIVI